MISCERKKGVEGCRVGDEMVADLENNKTKPNRKKNTHKKPTRALNQMANHKFGVATNQKRGNAREAEGRKEAEGKRDALRTC